MSIDEIDKLILVDKHLQFLYYPKPLNLPNIFKTRVMLPIITQTSWREFGSIDIV